MKIIRENPLAKTFIYWLEEGEGNPFFIKKVYSLWGNIRFTNLTYGENLIRCNVGWFESSTLKIYEGSIIDELKLTIGRYEKEEGKNREFFEVKVELVEQNEHSSGRLLCWLNIHSLVQVGSEYWHRVCEHCGYDTGDEVGYG